MPSISQEKENAIRLAGTSNPIQALTAPLDQSTPIRAYELNFERYYEALLYRELWTIRQALRKFEALRTSLSKLEHLQANWDTYNAEAPSPGAIGRAENALSVIEEAGYIPSAVVPSGEGGVAICFSHKWGYADIEFFNSGETLAVAYRTNEDPEVWTLDDSEHAIENTLKVIYAKFAE